MSLQCLELSPSTKRSIFELLKNQFHSGCGRWMDGEPQRIIVLHSRTVGSILVSPFRRDKTGTDHGFRSRDCCPNTVRIEYPPGSTAHRDITPGPSIDITPGLPPTKSTPRTLLPPGSCAVGPPVPNCRGFLRGRTRGEAGGVDVRAAHAGGGPGEMVQPQPRGRPPRTSRGGPRLRLRPRPRKSSTIKVGGFAASLANTPNFNSWDSRISGVKKLRFKDLKGLLSKSIPYLEWNTLLWSGESKC